MKNNNSNVISNSNKLRPESVTPHPVATMFLLFSRVSCQRQAGRAKLLNLFEHYFKM